MKTIGRHAFAWLWGLGIILLALCSATAVSAQTTYNPYAATAGSFDSATFYFSNVQYDSQLLPMRISVQCVEGTEYLTIYGNAASASVQEPNSGPCNAWTAATTVDLNGMKVVVNPSTWTIVRQCVPTRSGGTCFYKIYQYSVSITVE